MRAQEIQINSIDDIPEVEEYPVRIKGKETEYKAIIEKETGKTVSITSATYQLVQHREVWNSVQQMTQYLCRGKLCKNGKLLVIELEDKTDHFELLPGDYLRRGARIFNSYDLTRALTVQSYGLRLICKNGAVAPGMVDRIRKVHQYQNIEVPEIADYVELAMAAWSASAETLQLAARKTVIVKQALKLVQRIPEKYLKIVKDNLDETETVYNIWNELTRTIMHDAQPHIATPRLVKMQLIANRVFTILQEGYK